MPKGTYSLFGRSLPRFGQGRVIRTSTLNASLEALERSGPVPGQGDGLEYTQLPNGIGIRALPPTVAKVAVVTTTVSKMVGATPGMGRAELRAMINGVLVPTGQVVDVYSILSDKLVNAGAYVKVATVDGHWFVDTVGKCSDLATAALPATPTPVPPANVVSTAMLPDPAAFVLLSAPPAAFGPPPPPVVYVPPPTTTPPPPIIYAPRFEPPASAPGSAAGGYAWAAPPRPPSPAVTPPPVVYGWDGAGVGTPGSPGSGGGTPGYTFTLKRATPEGS